ncbi:hypothetical protein EDB83DRAFT_2677299 [Lactarius deliciosus]|nr:hypothetical protein EDB83DRAFT_2677299 [Lactarius deliciosus]
MSAYYPLRRLPQVASTTRYINNTLPCRSTVTALNLSAPIPTPSPPNTTNSDDAYADVRLPSDPVVVLMSSTIARVRQPPNSSEHLVASTDARMTLGGGDNYTHEPCRSVYSVDHSTQTTGSIDDADAPQHKRDSWIFEDKFATIIDPRQQGLRQRLMVKFGGGSTMANGNVSRERFFLTHEMFDANYDLFRNSRTSGANPDRRYLDVYFVPGFYKVLNKEVNPKGLEVADYGLYYLDVGERYNGCARRDMTLRVTEGCFCKYVVVELRPGGITQDMARANKKESWQIAEQFRVSMEGTCRCYTSDGVEIA